MFCRSCGENIPVDSVFCPNCGKNLLEVASQAVNAEPTEWEADEPAAPVWRRLRRDRTADQAPPEDDSTVEADHPPAPPRARVNWAMWERLGLMRVLWGMGLMFSAVGFIVGLAGSPVRALTWILFGVALILAAPHASTPASNPLETDEQEEANE